MLTPLQSFTWLTTAGLLGVLLAVPMRQHFVVDEKLTYADGMAAGETLIVLDGRGTESRRAASALAFGCLASAALMLMTEDARVLNWFPSVMVVGTAVTMTTGVGVNWSLLALGSGMLVGMRINASMLLGMIIAWVVAPYALLHYQVLGEGFTRNDVLFWVMWPATGMMVSAGLAALVLRWKILVKTFGQLSTGNVGSDSFPLTWVAGGAAVMAVALVVVQKVSLGLEVWATVVAILLSLPMMLVGLRVLGETNWRANQCPVEHDAGDLRSSRTGSLCWRTWWPVVTTGTIAVESEALMRDYKAGHDDRIVAEISHHDAVDRHAGRSRRRVMDVPVAAQRLRHRGRTCRAPPRRFRESGPVSPEILSAGRERSAAGRRHRPCHRLAHRSCFRRPRKPARGLDSLADGCRHRHARPGCRYFRDVPRECRGPALVADRSTLASVPTWFRSRRG